MISGTALKENEVNERLDNDDATLYRQIVGSTVSLSNVTTPNSPNAQDN